MCNVISDQEAEFYGENGYHIVRGLLRGEELQRVQEATQALYEYGAAQERAEPDYMYGRGHLTGAPVLRRVEYVIDKHEAMKTLLAHPFILRSTEKLMGSDLFPTWDAMVLKAPGEGILVPWHRDAGTDFVGDRPIFNVDFYLDRATEENCVWTVPGSHRWPAARAKEWIETHRAAATREEFGASGAVPAIMEPGDVMFHDILVVHGSPATTAPWLRRVVYYEFRTAHVEAAIGPHTPDYIRLKQKVLLACIERRKRAEWAPADEEAFAYCPPAPFDTVTPGEEPETYRYPHEQYWRR